MPAKKHQITDAERAENMRKLAREVGADNDAAALDRALKKLAERQPEPPKAGDAKKG